MLCVVLCVLCVVCCVLCIVCSVLRVVCCVLCVVCCASTHGSLINFMLVCALLQPSSGECAIMAVVVDGDGEETPNDLGAT